MRRWQARENMFPQTGFACRGSNGLAKGPWFLAGSGVGAGNPTASSCHMPNTTDRPASDFHLFNPDIIVRQILVFD